MLTNFSFAAAMNKKVEIISYLDPMYDILIELKSYFMNLVVGAIRPHIFWTIFYKNDHCAEYNILSSHTQIVVSQSNMQLHERLS